MHYREYQPHPALQDFVENYWFMQTDSLQEELVIPDGNAGLMFLTNRVKRFDVGAKTPAQMQRQAVVVGQKNRPVIYQFEPQKNFLTFGVRFRPYGLCAFTKMPMVNLKNQVVEAREVFGPSIQQAAEDIAQASEPGARVKTVDKLLLQCLRTSQPQQTVTQQIIRLIFERRGQYRAGDWSRQFGVSERKMERLFQQYVGLSPKTFACVVRFNHVVYSHQKQSHQRLTDLAYANGYFDQMHFVKEVKQFTHKTPKQYLRYSAGNWSQLLCSLLAKRFSC